MADKEERLKVFLETETKKFSKLLIQDSKSLIKDIDKLYYIMGADETSYIEKEYWEYFKLKYEIVGLEQYIPNFDEMIRVFYYSCIMPLNLEMDHLYDPNKDAKATYKTTINKMVNALSSLFGKIWSSLLLLLLIVIAILFSYYYKNINNWLSSIFIGVATGLLAAYIITFVNKYLEIRTEKYSSIAHAIKNLTNNFFDKYKDINEKINSFDDNSNELLLYCVDLNNDLTMYLKSIEKYQDVKSLNGYYLMVDLEVEFSELTLKMIQGVYFRDYPDPTLNDYRLLKLTVFSFTVQKKKFIAEVNNLLSKLYNNIDFFRKKKI